MASDGTNMQYGAPKGNNINAAAEQCCEMCGAKDHTIHHCKSFRDALKTGNENLADITARTRALQIAAKVIEEQKVSMFKKMFSYRPKTKKTNKNRETELTDEGIDQKTKEDKAQ